MQRKTWFSGVELSNDDLTVKGTYEDGTEKEVTGYALSETKIKQGKIRLWSQRMDYPWKL